ncbi:Retrovirus-related Pol polyprotein from transposon [Smittium culicis]|uniref:Retrovirus-related Pol polyprotein from transposon n=1 Tax=Smittium culicis TaxID=133412 RepID=A0A1R1YI35_9FUNG|nr:Retrovirus-related Pol polyprotein from transposon [Smittium culicis]
MLSKVADELELSQWTTKAIKLKLGNNSASKTSNKIVYANICFGNTVFDTTFRLMDAQPYDVILGANFIVATNTTYDTKTMTITFENDELKDKIKICSVKDKLLNHQPILLAAAVNDKNETQIDDDIKKIISTIPDLFDSKPSMTSFCRSFMDGFTELAAPLYKLLNKETSFNWNSDCEIAFQKLKNAMISAPALAHPDTTQSYIMYTDASNIGIGASLHQKQSDKTIRPIAYTSRKLLPAEVNYCASGKEALAVVYGFSKFHHYVHGSCTELHTEHRALITTLNNEDPRGRFARWNSALQAYDFNVKHIKGLDNGLTDALSRDFEDTSEMLPMAIDNNNEIIENTNNSFLFSKYLPSKITVKQLQVMDVKINRIMDILKGLVRPERHEEIQTKSYKIIDDLLYNINHDDKSTKLYVPKTLIKAIIFHHHDTPISSHLGHKRTLEKVRKYFFWLKMSRDIFGYIQSCKECQLTKHSSLKAPGELQSIHVTEPFEMISIDYCGPFPESNNGNRYILIITEHLTRWVEAIATKDTSADTTIKAIEDKIIFNHGCPKKLLSDNASYFKSELFTSFCRRYGIKHLFSSPYHPETNGTTERFNRTIKSMIKVYIEKNQNEWDKLLNSHLLAYRTAKHETLGISPFESLYGREARLPADALMPDNISSETNSLEYERLLKAKLEPIRKIIIHNDKINKAKSEDRYNRRHRAVEYKVGDKVLIKRKIQSDKNNSLTLSTNYIGPFIIKKKIGRVSYLIEDEKKKRRITSHIQRMKYFYSRDESRPIGEEDNVENNNYSSQSE